MIVIACVNIRPMRHIESKTHSEAPLFVYNTDSAVVSLSSNICPIQRVTVTIRKCVVHLSCIFNVGVSSYYVLTVAWCLIFQAARAVNRDSIILADINPLRFRVRSIKLNKTSLLRMRWITPVGIIKNLVPKYDFTRVDTSRLILSRIISKPRNTIHAITSIIFEVWCCFSCFSLHLPAKFSANILLIDFHTWLSVYRFLLILLGGIPTEVMHWALIIFLANLGILSVSWAHWLERPIREDIAVGASFAISMVVATHVHWFALAGVLITDWWFALVVVLAVPAWVLVLSHSNRFLTKSLFLTPCQLRSRLIRTVRISCELYLKVLFDPRVLFLIVQDKWAEVRLSCDWRFFDVEA